MALVNSQYLDQVLEEGSADRPVRAGEVVPRWVLQRIKLLDEKDRSLVELHLSGASLNSAGRALGLSSGTAWRRLQRVMSRVRHPLVGALLDEHCTLPHEHRYVGVEYFLQGRPARHSAERHQMNERHVKSILAFLKLWQAARTGKSYSPRRHEAHGGD